MFRFTIRDALLDTVIVGLIVGWWLDHRQMVALQDRLATTIGEIYQRSLPGKPLASIVREQRLEDVPLWNMPNLPPGDDGEVIYFLERGDLVLRFAGEPAAIKAAEFRFSNKSAEQRFREVTAGWSSWVDAHSD
jgi:hypothetical protein